jgi:hypothetical protein
MRTKRPDAAHQKVAEMSTLLTSPVTISIVRSRGTSRLRTDESIHPVRSISEIIASLIGRFGRLSRDVNTARFLKQRNVRLTIRPLGSQSFYVVRVTPRTDISAPNDTLRFQIKLLPTNRVRISVYSKTKRQFLADLTIPNNPAAGTLKLDFDSVHLDIDVDAEQTSPSS